MTGPPPTYWLLADGVPTGPFTADEIRAKVARGEAATDAPTCPLGGSVWTPLSGVPALASTAASDAAAGGHAESGAAGDAGDAADKLLDRVKNRHVADVRYYAFLTCVLLAAPTGATRALGTPKAGFEDFVTLWNVAALTLPLTAAVAAVTGWLFVLARRPERRPKTDRDRAALGGVFAGLVLGSMLVGAWLGAVEVPEPVAAARAAVPERTQGFVLRAVLNQAARDKRFALGAVAAGAAASLGVYFTLYGPVLFGSSVAVGVLLGYVWGYKPVEVYDERAAGGSTPEAVAAGRLRRRVVGGMVAAVAAVALAYHWGGEAALWRGGLAVGAATLAVAAALGHLRNQKTHPEPRPRPALAGALAIGAVVAGWWAYQSHFEPRYECRVDQAGHLEFGGRWVRDRGPDRVYLKNTSPTALTNVRLVVTGAETGLSGLGGKSWAETLTVPRVEPGQEVSWPVSTPLGQARFTYALVCDQQL